MFFFIRRHIAFYASKYYISFASRFPSILQLLGPYCYYIWTAIICSIKNSISLSIQQPLPVKPKAS